MDIYFCRKRTLGSSSSKRTSIHLIRMIFLYGQSRARATTCSASCTTEYDQSYISINGLGNPGLGSEVYWPLCTIKRHITYLTSVLEFLPSFFYPLSFHDTSDSHIYFYPVSFPSNAQTTRDFHMFSPLNVTVSPLFLPSDIFNGIWTDGSKMILTKVRKQNLGLWDNIMILIPA